MTQPASNGNLILDPHTLGSKVLEWKKAGYHVLSPAIQVSNFAPGYGVNASLVLLDPSIDNDDTGEMGAGDVYYDKATMDGDERAPSKIGLMKIAAAAGVSWVEPYGRKDPMTIQNLWIYQVTGVYLAYDGTPQLIKGEKEIDYRDGSAQIGEWTREAQAKLQGKDTVNGWSERRVRQARCNGAERAETGALTRAIRTLGVKHTYKVAELLKPFVTLRVCPVVNMEDPGVRAMVAERQLAGVAALYAPATSRAALPAAHVADRVIIDVQPQRQPVAVQQPAAQTHQAPAAPPAAQQQAPAPVAPPAPAVAAPDPGQSEWGEIDREDLPLGREEAPAQAVLPGTVTIKKVVRREKPYGATHAKAGQKFTIWDVTDSTGQLSSTAFGRWGHKAEAAEKSGEPVVLVTVRNRFNEMEIQNVKTLAEAAASQPQPLAEMKL